MADANIDLQASNIFGLHANFNTQGSGTSETTVNVATNDESGNVACQKNIEDITNYTQTASYCGSDFVADLGTFLTEFGNVQDSKVVTGLTVTMSASGYVTVEVSGHNHDTNAHVAGLPLGHADFSDMLPHEIGEPFAAWDGFGVPSFGVTVGNDASPSSATLTLSMNHIDVQDEAGKHLVGKNITPRAELSMSFEGVPTSETIAALETNFDAMTGDLCGALVDSIDKNDGNSEFDTFAFTAHANVDLATA